jgi:hypothetical protein
MVAIRPRRNPLLTGARLFNGASATMARRENSGPLLDTINAAARRDDNALGEDAVHCSK